MGTGQNELRTLEENIISLSVSFCEESGFTNRKGSGRTQIVHYSTLVLWWETLFNANVNITGGNREV